MNLPLLYVPVFIRRPIAKMPVTVGFCIIDLQRKHSTVIVSYTVNLGKAMNGCKRVSGRQTKEASRNFLMTFRESYQAIAWRNNEDDIQVLAAMVILQSYSKHYFCILVYLFYYGVWSALLLYWFCCSTQTSNCIKFKLVKGKCLNSELSSFCKDNK